MGITIPSTEASGFFAQAAAERTHAGQSNEARLCDLSIAEHERRPEMRSALGWIIPKGALLGFLAAVVLTAASAASYSFRRINHVSSSDPIVSTDKPVCEVLLDLSGFLVPRTKIVVSPQVNGVVSRVHILEEGQKVKSGDLLFEIEDVRYRTEYEQAEAALAAAESRLEELENGHEPEEKAHAQALYEQAKVQETLAAIEYERARRLTPSAIGPAEYDRIWAKYYDARAAVKVQKTNVDIIESKTRHEKINAAKAEVKRTKAIRDRAKYYLDKTKIRAPADAEGKPRLFTVLQKNVHPGECIQADFTCTALCTLADLSEMEAEVEVQERDLHLLHKGMICQLFPDAYPDRCYRGVLSHIQPLVNRQRGVVQVNIALTAPDEYLLPDMNVRVLFLKDKSNSDSK